MRVRKIDLLEYTLLLLFCIPSPLTNYSVVKILQYVRWIGLAYTVMHSINSIAHMRNRTNSPMLSVYLYLLWMFLTSLLHGNNMRSVISTLYPLFVVSFLGYRVLKRDEKVFISFFSAVFGIYLILNYVTYINGAMYTEFSSWGARKVYFLGISTTCQYLAFIAFGFLAVKDFAYAKNNKIGVFTVVCVSAAILFFIGVWNSSGIACSIIYFLLIFFIKRWNSRIVRRLAIASIIIGSIITFLIVFQNIQQHFSWLIVDILGEDLNMNSRISIWNSLLYSMDALDYLIGNGIAAARRFVLMNGNVSNNAHNQYLDIIYNGGAVGLLLFFNMCFQGVRCSFQKMSKTVLPWSVVTFVTLLITGINEVSCNTPYFYLFLVWMLGSAYYGGEHAAEQEIV